MKPATFNSQPVFLITEAPDWTDLPSCEFSLTRDRQESLTKREARRPYSATLLCRVVYTSIVSGAALRQLQGSLRSLTVEPVVLPFFLFKARWADRAAAAVQGGLMIVWKDDWSQFEIYAAGDAEPTWPMADDNWVPALMGFITKSAPEMLSGDVAAFKVEFAENSPADFALKIQDSTFTDGPTPAGYSIAPKLLPALPDFSRISKELRVTIARDQIGFTREQSATFYTHEVFRGQAADYTLVDGQTAALLKFFEQYMGPGASFWAPSWFNVAKFTQDVAAADTVLQVADTTAIVAGDYLSLYGDDSAAVKVLSKTVDTITLAAAVGTHLSADITCVFPLNLVRLDDPVLKLSWVSQNVVAVTLPITELRAEYTPAADETLGTTLGRLPQRVVLFQFDRDLGNGPVATSRFTNYEAAVSYGGHTWLSASFSHGDIPQSLNLEEDAVALTSFVSAGNPLLDDAALRSEAPLGCAILWADYDGATVSNVAAVFAGEITEPSRDGDKLTAKIVAGPSALDVQVPRLLHGLMCNHITGANVDGSFLISAGCTLLKSDWKFTGTVAGPLNSAWPFEINLTGLARVTGAAPTYFLDWFALGWIEWNTGANIQRRLILKSTIPSSGAVTLTLHNWFEGAGPQTGDAVLLYPGCDGTKETCRAYNGSTNPTGKFDNYVNFGGEPFTPVDNPSLLKLSTPTAGGKK